MRLHPYTVAFASLAALHCGSTTTEPHPDAGHDAGHPTTDGSPPTHDAGADSSPGCVPSVPLSHVTAPSACSTTRPPSIPGDGGSADAGELDECTNDSQCTMGVNGRCVQGGGQIQELICSYDECSSAAPCMAGNLCVCGTSDGTGGRSSNACLPSNCTSDADCGAGGYCSPTYDTTCGAFDGVVGYYCHEAAHECTVDECVNDSDCAEPDAGVSQGGSGYCAWDGESSRWTCAYAACAG